MITERERLDAWLSQFSPDEQERIIQYALDHVLPNLPSSRLKSDAAAQAPQPAQAQPQREALAEAIEWEMLDGTNRTTDIDQARNWANNVGVRVVRRAALPAPPVPTADVSCSSDPTAVVEARERSSGRWLPIDSAPKDGTCVLLLIEGGEHQMQDDDPSVSIGSYGVEGGPEEDPTWNFAGWSWHQDCYCRGTGTPVGWLPLPPTSGQQGRVQAAEASGSDEQS